MKKLIQFLVLPALTLLMGCGGGHDIVAPATGQNVVGAWTVTRTQTAASHTQCGAVGNVENATWTITQADGASALSVISSVVGNPDVTYAGSVDAAGKFLLKEERIVSVAGRCFIAATGTLTGDFNVGAGAFSQTLTSDPSSSCVPLNVPATCTAAFMFTVRR